MNIVIFGWFGASTKHLEKYKHLFHQLGGHNIYLHQSNIRQCITYTGWKTMRNNPPDWISEQIDMAIIFSGGVFPYINYKIARHDFQPTKLIFDSGIFFPTPNQTSNYLKHILPAAGSLIFPTRLSSMAINTLWTMQKYNWKKRLAEFEQQLSCQAEKLIINSANDPFILRHDLEKFLIRYSGGPITEHLFQKSGHVQHFRFHPHEYKNLLKEFMSA